MLARCAVQLITDKLCMIDVPDCSASFSNVDDTRTVSYKTAK